MVNIEQILDPITSKVFFTEYWQKKHLVVRRNKFKDIFNFNDLNKYLNRFPYVRGLQVIDYTKQGDGRWCLDKVMSGKLKLPKLKRSDIFELWEQGKTFVIPFAENETKQLHDIVKEFEKYFSHGQANVYASPKANSKSFPAHADGTENFLFHTEGKTKWTIYKDKKDKEVLEKFTLDAGDLLYIPIGVYHKVETIGPRILVSIHFQNKPNQTLEKFTIKDDNKRQQWYNWTPDIPKEKTRPARLMNKANWSKPYFNKNKF